MRYVFIIAFLINSCISALYSQCPTGTPSGANLVINGDFQQGNTGFTSDYTLYSGNYMPAGRYAIVTNARHVHTLWAGQGRSGASDLFLVANGADDHGKRVWCQTVNVEPSSDYLFSAYVSSVYEDNPALLQFRVNNQLIGSQFQAPSNLNNWVQFNANWNSGAFTTAEICIINSSILLSGNDFGIDDIVFEKCCNSNNVQLISDTAICKSESLQLWASGAHNYTWYPNYNITDTKISNPLVFPDITTRYFLITQNANCIDTFSVLVSIEDDTCKCSNLNFTISNDKQICKGDSVLLQADGADNYKWFPDSLVNDPNASSTYVNPTNNTVIFVELEKAGCKDTLSVNINVLNAKGRLLSPDKQLCENSTDTVNATGGVFYYWSPSGIIEFATSSTTRIFPDSSQSVFVEITDENGCKSIDSLMITINPNDTGYYSIDTTICEGITIALNGPSGNTFNYSWSDGSSKSFILVSKPSDYLLIAHDTIACNVQIHSYKLDVEHCISVVFVPTAFSPTGDEINDSLNIYTENLTIFNLKIFNRWGEKIFETDSPDKMWNGTAYGKPVKEDVYVFLLHAIGIDGKIYNYSGSITLLR